MNKLTVILDIDDVLINFLDTIVNEYNKIYGTNHIMEEDITDWNIDNEVFEHNFFSVFEKNKDIIKQMKLKDDKISDVLDKYTKLGVEFIVVSATQEKNTFEDKIELFKEYGIDKYFSKIINTDCKFVISADVIVDDYIENLNDYKKYHPFSYTLLFDMCHNQNVDMYRHTRVRNWEELDFALSEILEYFNNL